MVQLHHVDVADHDLLIDFLAGATVEEHALTGSRQLGLLEIFADAFLGNTIEDRSRDFQAELLTSPTEMRFQNLADIHARRHSEGVQADFDWSTIRKERHIFFRNNLRNNALVTVATGHLVSDFKLLLRGDIDFDLLDRAVTGALSSFNRTHLTLAISFEFIELRLIAADDLHDLDPDRRRINLDVLGYGCKTPEKSLRDLSVGWDDDFAGFTVDHVERDFFAKKDVGKGFSQALAQFIDLRFVFLLNLFALAAPVRGREFLLLIVDPGRYLYVHDDSTNARWNNQRSILNIGGFFTEDRAEQLFFRGKLGFRLRRNFADENVTRLHFRTDPNNTVMIEVLERLFTDVRDIARDLFRPELGVASVDLELLDVNRGEDVFLQNFLRNEDGVFEVITVPRHEADEHVAS